MTEQDAMTYLILVTRRALDDTGLDYEIKFGSAGSNHQCRNDVHIIRYGARSIVRCLSGEWTEYDYVARSLGTAKSFYGKEALHRLALHESAHAIQVSNGKRYRGDVHNEHFVKILRELYEKVPLNGTVLYHIPENYIHRDRAWCMAKYKAGDTCQFDWQGQTYQVRIISFDKEQFVTRESLTDVEYRIWYSTHDAYNFRPLTFDGLLDGLFD